MSNKHLCHWPKCQTPVPPAMWGCRDHWFQLPVHLRLRIWKAYRAGQEITKTPSAEYVKVAMDVQAWIRNQANDSNAELQEVGQ